MKRILIVDDDEDPLNGYKQTIITARPLPAGVYSIFDQSQSYEEIPCNFLPPEPAKNKLEWVIDVTAQSNTVHEAFFDPEEGKRGGSGAGGSKGILRPTSFTDGHGTTVTIERVEWVSGKVTMAFSSPAPQVGHHVDVIALDGSVALRLRIEDASRSADGDSTALTWGVCSQPWAAGEKLMLRISESGPDLTGETNDVACLSPSP